MNTPDLRGRADDLDALVRGGNLDRRDALCAALDVLERRDFGLVWRYVPGGVFTMGSDGGDADERPPHAVQLRGYWMTTVPISWADYCRLMGWRPPPVGLPEPSDVNREELLALHPATKVRLQYCEDHTTRAIDWHAHDPDTAQKWSGPGGPRTAQDIFGTPPRVPPDAPYTYAAKPMVDAGWHAARDLGERLSTAESRVDLPTEAQWERAARGLWTGRRYPWGDTAEPGTRCDCDAFDRFSLLPSAALPANDYGLHAMCGGVWEWCRDQYDAEQYARSARSEPWREPDTLGPPPSGSFREHWKAWSEFDQREFVLRGGSWTDCPESCTVSFRMSARSQQFDAAAFASTSGVNIGFRLVLQE